MENLLLANALKKANEIQKMKISISNSNGWLRIIRFKVSLALMIMSVLIHPALIAQMKNEMKGQVNNSDSSKGITIHQEIYFKVSPQRVYHALVDSKEFSDCTKKSFDMFSATSAKIDPKEGGYFSVFDGHIIGRFL